MNLSGTAYHPDLGTLVDYEAIPLSNDPDTQVAQTISRMRRNVIEDAGSPAIQRDAAIIQASGSGDPISDTFWWVKDRVGFVQDAKLAGPVWRGDGDPVDGGQVVEVLIRPRDLADMRIPQEDCDGFASYGPALLLAQGVPCSFMTVAADAREPGRFSHVYAKCTDPKTGERVSLDASHGPYPGWEAIDTGQVTRVQEWPIGPDWVELLVIGAVLYVLGKVFGVL